MVPAEEEALNAWIMGALVLDAPPACTHTFLQRMAYVKFFEDYLEGTVVAVVPPRILMPEHIAEKTILMQLLASEPAGSAGYKNLCEWIQNVKRLYYTAATRRLTFIVKEQSIATKWHRREIKLRNEKLVLLSTAKLEEEDDRCDIDNVIPHQAGALQYQVRVVAPGLGNDIVGQLMALSTECEVVSIARAPKCTRAPEDRQMQFHRDFEPEIKQAKEMSKFELQHMSLEVRQKYIGNLSNSLGKVMANLKSKATEKALLSEMLQPADSSSSTGSAAVAAAANSATDAQSVTPSEAECSGSIGTGTPETSIKASNGQSNRKALQARKKRELELEAILAGKLSSADSVLDGVRANSTQAKQKVAIDARLSTAQATLGNAKEHLSKASSAHSFALDRDELKEPDTSGRDEESSSVNHEAGQFQRQIELLDLQQCVAAKEAAAALLILQEAKNVNNRAEK
ncbi:hypothetical protein FI667_g6345, partial [Globisporangium splendens]